MAVWSSVFSSGTLVISCWRFTLVRSTLGYQVTLQLEALPDRLGLGAVRLKTLSVAHHLFFLAQQLLQSWYQIYLFQHLTDLVPSFPFNKPSYPI